MFTLLYKVEVMWEDIEYNGEISCNTTVDGIGQWAHTLKLMIHEMNTGWEVMFPYPVACFISKPTEPV
jgi:hypothetical protein